ncbi:MAG: hypothetical protein ACK5Q5_07035, partial [Planctomycetaceae bacterium]
MSTERRRVVWIVPLLCDWGIWGLRDRRGWGLDRVWGVWSRGIGMEVESVQVELLRLAARKLTGADRRA